MLTGLSKIQSLFQLLKDIEHITRSGIWKIKKVITNYFIPLVKQEKKIIYRKKC